MSNLLICNVDIVTMNTERDVVRNGYISVQGERIQEIGLMDELDVSRFIGFEKIKTSTTGKNFVALPGFVQTHVHTTQSLGRGLADDVDLVTWTRKRIWPYEAALTEEDAYVASMLSIAEMIRSGTTSFCEASGEMPDSIVEAILDTGITGIVCLSTMDLPGEIPESLRMTTGEAIDKNLKIIDRYHGKHARVDACLNILNLFLSSPDLWREFTKISIEENILLQTHVAESKSEIEHVKRMTGMSSVAYLNSLGALHENLLAAHVVHIDDQELEMLVENNVKVMHLPAADLRIAGYARIPEMLDRGIPVSLGVNSPPCSNRMSIMDDMWLASLMHKAVNDDPALVPARTVLEMATINGAIALKRDHETGSLEKGKLADIILLDLNKIVATPTHEIYSTIVYQATSETVHTVVAQGNILMENRELRTINEEWLIQEGQRKADAIVKRAGIVY